MPNFAIIGGNDIVTNIIVADSLEEAQTVGEAVQYTDDNFAYIGGKYDRKNNRFLDIRETNANL